MHAQDGPIDPQKTVAAVRQEPYNLPDRSFMPAFSSSDPLTPTADHFHVFSAMLREKDWLGVMLTSCLPCSFVWSTCDVNDSRTMEEVLCRSAMSFP